VGVEPGGIACIEQIHGAAKDRVFDAFITRKVEAVGWRWFLDVNLEAWPIGKAILACDG
jgi:hypothetical protein